MADIDCLLIGHNELDFQDYCNILENMASSGGRDHVAFTDLQLNHVEYNGRRQQGLDMLTTLYNEGRSETEKRNFYNGDCLWTAIAYLGSYLDARGYTIDYVNLFQSEKGLLKQKLKDNNYRLIALTGTMYVFEQNIWEVVSFIRRNRRDAKIIAGGPYISKQAEEREPEYLKPLFKYLNADFYAYAREGEETLVRVIETIKHDGDFNAIPELAYRSGREFVVTGKPDRLALPKEAVVTIQRNTAGREPGLERTAMVSGKSGHDHSFVKNMINYSLFADAYRPSGWANIRVSDGCPYACGFCSFPEHGNEHYIIMRMERIEQELTAIKESGAITHLFFVDATLNVPKKQFKAMLQMMIRNRYGFKWHCFFRCDQTDEEMIALMAEAGCEGVFLGLESANETVLRNMDKTAHKDDFRRAIPWFKQYGIRQMVSVQVGFPGETYASFYETLDFLEEIAPDYTRIQIWFCDTTTPVWRRRQEFKLEGKGYGWSHYSMDAETAVELVVNSFMSLRNITWVPDPGYNWVAFYSMQKLGMPIDRQKQFLQLFAAAAREKLLNPNRREIDAGLLREMAVCAKFDVTDEPDMSVAERYSGDRYRAAEAFWTGKFGTTERHETNSLTAEEVRLPQKLKVGSLSVKASLDRDALVQLSQACNVSMSGAVAAVVAAAMGNTGDDGAFSMLTSLDDDAPIPLTFPASLSSDLAALASFAEMEMTAAMPHRRFGMFVLGSPLRMKQHGLYCQKLKTLVLLSPSAESLAALIEARFPFAPAIAPEPNRIVAFTAGATADELTVELAWSPHSGGPEVGAVWLSNLVELIGSRAAA